MARLGIDFGTTNTVAVLHDRGLLAVVLHEAKTKAGNVVQEVFPSAILIEKKSQRRWFGIEADRRFVQIGPAASHLFIPSLKRQLRDYAEGRFSPDPDGNGRERAIAEDAEDLDLDLGGLLTGFLDGLARSIRRSR